MVDEFLKNKLQFLPMTEDSQIIDFAGQTPMEILDAIQKLLIESEFQRFTLLLVRKKAEPNEAMLNSATSKMPHRPSRGSGFLMRNSGSLHHQCVSDISGPNYMASFSQTGQDSTQDSLTEGLRLYDGGDFQGALRVFGEQQRQLRQSLKEGAGGVKLYQDVIFHMGNCYYRVRNYDKAVEFFSKEFQGQDMKQKGQKLNNLASCYAHLNQSRLSLKNYSQALKIYSEFPEIDCSNLLNNLGMLYAQSGMFQTAERYFLRSIQQRKLKSPDNSSALQTSYLHLGNCQKHAKKYANAAASLGQALAFAQRGFGSEAETLLQLAAIYELMQRWADALDCYERLSRKEERKGYLFERAAHIHRFMGHFADFDRFIKKAYECYCEEKNQRKITQLQPVIARAKK